MPPKFIFYPQTVSYLRSQLDKDDASQTKRALQYICRMHRNGYFFTASDRFGIEQSIVGMLQSPRSKDEKLRRWGLNALARLGTVFSFDCVISILEKFIDCPQTVASAIAALYKIEPDVNKFVNILNRFDPQLRILAALQHIEPNKLNLSDLPINIENASLDVLKLGLVVVGLDKAPPNLFHPHHANEEIVKVLGKHENEIVSQYAVWAVTENNKLSIKNLGIPLSSVESLLPNVRSWVYRAIAMDAESAAENQDFISGGTRDENPDVRLGLAIGLKDTFFDGIQNTVFDWHSRECNQEVSYSLLDHVVRNSINYSNYEEFAVQHYERESENSLLRQRMEGHAIGTPIYQRFKMISYNNGSNDLFSGGSKVINNTTINGTIGAFSIEGDVNNSGKINVRHQQQIEAIQEGLNKAWLAVNNLDDSALKQRALAEIKSAQADPSKDKVSGVMNTLERIESVAKKASNVATSVSSIGASISTLSGIIKLII